jgi:hypothetical protein
MISDNLYGENYEPDPVTPDAVAAAMAATDPGKKRLFDRISASALALIAVLGGIFAVNSVYDTITLHDQGVQIEQQATCQNTFVSTYIAERTSAKPAQLTRRELQALIRDCPGIKITVVVQP